MTDLTLEQQRDLAMWMFPRAWAEAERQKGERRRRKLANLRHRAEPTLQVAWLRHQGHSCADCVHIRAGSRYNLTGHVCYLHSDNDGYAKTNLERICHQWEKRS